jgi:hypothetical protein
MTKAQIDDLTQLALQFGVRPGDAAYGAVLAAYQRGLDDMTPVKVKK